MNPFASTLAVVAALLLPGSVRAAAGAEAAADDLRFAFSSSMFTEVNENDAKASVKAWGLALARERGVRLETHPVLLQGVGQIAEAIRTAAVDGAAVTTAEYLALPPNLQGTNLFLSQVNGTYTETYQLLVRSDSGIRDLAGLAGRRLIVFDSHRASLALPWLDLALATNGAGPASRHFARIQTSSKLPKVVLPVFFKQQDACLVTERGFRIMSELNPQVRAQLRALATSPAMVPALGFMRPNYDSPHRAALMGALKGLEKSVAGTQVLTLFQSDELHEASPVHLESARVLLQAHQRLMASNTPATRPVPLSP